MIKTKIYSWLIQIVLVFIYLAINWGFNWSILFQLTFLFVGILFIPLSLLIDFLTKRLPYVFQMILSFLILNGISVIVFSPSQGWILSSLFGLTFWLPDELLKWRSKTGNQK